MASVLWILGDWRFVVALMLVALTLFYFATTSNFDYWKKRGVPVVNLRPVPFFGHMWKMMLGLQNVNNGFSDVYNAVGDRPFAGFMQSMNPAIILKDPELIKHILIKDSNVFLDHAFHTSEENDPLNGKGIFNLRGRKWKEMRARLSPAFTSGRMKTMFPLMLKCGDEMVNSLRIRIDKGDDVIEIKEYVNGYSLDVIAACGFGVDCDALRNPESSEFKKMGKLLFKLTWKRRFILLLFFVAPKIMEFLGVGFTIEETAVFFRNFVKSLVEAREKALEEEEKTGVPSKQFSDFIQHLVLIKNRGLNTMKLDDEDEKRFDLEGENPAWASIGLDDITAQVMIFFSAGFEPSSSTLTFALFELSVSKRGQKIQSELRAEIQKVMREYDGKLTYEGIKKMHLLDRIMNETLRLYPPIGLLTRRNTKEYTIPGTNHVLEPFTQVFISTQDMHHDPHCFPDPMLFDPNRFLPENKDNHVPYKYIPFGDGPRHCIGQRFAELQARVAMCFLIKNFEFDVCREKTAIPIKIDKKAFVLTAEGGIWLRMKPTAE